jgi:hypothetical protein
MRVNRIKDMSNTQLLHCLLWSGIEDGKQQTTSKSREMEQLRVSRELLKRLGDEQTDEHIYKFIMEAVPLD